MPTQFIGSFETLDQLPKTGKVEFAFIGRSNVGKSSLINLLIGQRMAHVSGQPGKTRHFNYFLVDNSWYLVDLPGYGFARRIKKERDRWAETMPQYLIQREKLYCTFLLMDMSIPPQKKDLEMARWLGENQVPFAIVLTKSDRQSKTQNDLSYKRFEEELLKDWDTLPKIFITSSDKKIGKADIMKYIETVRKS
jgi:GTP-binding protein